jgi:hypothetical protein
MESVKRLALGALVGVLATLAFQRGTRYVHHLNNREADSLNRWAYLHVPAVLKADGANTLNVESQTIGASPRERERGETMSRVRLSYNVTGGVKVIRMICRFRRGELFAPSDDEVRALDSQAQLCPVSSEPLSLPQ